MRKSTFLLILVAANLLITNNLKAANPISQFRQDTLDPEQRLHDGVTKPVPRRISATPTNDVFVPRVDPQSWFIGFREPTVEIMIHDKNIKNHQVSIDKYGVTIQKIDRPENSNYLFVTLFISQSTSAGNVVIKLKNGADVRTFNWDLKKRTNNLLSPSAPKRNQGLTTADFVYLIMPDRFANGDPAMSKI
jgi:neopullulanase